MAERFDKFTERARRALQAAQNEAVRLGHAQITSEHLLLGVIHDRTGVATHALLRMDVQLDELSRDASVAAAAHLAPVPPLGGLSDSARKTIELAVDEARRLDHHYVGTEHLLLGLVRVETSPAAHALKIRGVTLQTARTAIAGVLNSGRPSDPPATPTTWRSTPMSPLGSSPEEQDLLQHVTAFLADPSNRPAESEAGLFALLSEATLLVLRHAYAEAQRFAHNYIGTEHILLGLVHDPQTPTARLLIDLGADLNKVRNAVEFIIGRGDRPTGGTAGLTPRAKKVLFLAIDEAHRLGHAQVDAEHLLLGVVREGEGIASGVLESLLGSTERIRTQILEHLGQAQVPPASARVSRGGRSAVLQAQLVARWYYHPQVDTEHLLVGLMRERGLAARALQDLGVQLPTLLEHFEALSPANASQPTSSGLAYTLAASAAIDRATWEADQRSQPRAGTGHLLLGVLAIEGGHARALLKRLNLSPEAIREALEPLLADDADSG